MNRLGLIARCDHKGLGQQTAAVWRNMAPAKTLLVMMGELSGLTEHPDTFPGARLAHYVGGKLPVEDIDWLLDGVDAIYSAETPYDFRLFGRADSVGVRTVLHLNPELDHHVRHPNDARPTVVALPTQWMASRYPDAVSLPMPVEPLTVQTGSLALHPGGWPAARDRNGTRLVLEASRHTEGMVVRTQANPDQPWHGARVEVADFSDTASLLCGAGVVVLPRRYGGLSLILQEAMAAGLPVLHTDCLPYGPQLPAEALLPVVGHEVIQTKGGNVKGWATSPEAIAARVEAIRNDVGLSAYLSAASTKWAAEHSWETLRPTWEAVLF